METDHIEPTEEGGNDRIENAIPVCFGCHAEIHSYNDKHPRGRKFTPNELRKHKAQWLRTCEEHPGALLAPSREADVGPLQALIDELTFNQKVATRQTETEQGGMFQDEQFRRAIEHGSVAILRDEIKEHVLDAYAAITAANGVIQGVWAQGLHSPAWNLGVKEARRRIIETVPKIEAANRALLGFLRSEPSTL